jgi:uncharacterized protein (DUF488 family)
MTMEGILKETLGKSLVRRAGPAIGMVWLLVGGLTPAAGQATSRNAGGGESPGEAGNAAPAREAREGNGLPGGGGGGGFLGGDLPFFDPGSETVTWDGRMWNVNNNRIFQARFERYLNEPEETSQVDQEYNQIIRRLLDLLAPGQVGPTSLDEAFRLLPQAAAFERDALICDALANQVQASWQALRARDRLAAANRSLAEERRRIEWNSRMAAQESPLTGGPPRSEAAAREWRRDRQLYRDMKMQPYITRLAEVNALLKANELKQEVSELQAKLEFQALLVHLFVQRRFQHVLIGTRFYRNIFADGDGQLQVGEDARNLFSRTSGMPPTVGTMDALASEIIRDVGEGVKAFQFLLENNELESATKRLAETFIVGEYLPEIRTLPREQKRQALAFVRASNQLISAIEVRDYSLAEKLVNELAETARDFDPSKPMAAIETARTVSAMHLAKAKNAAVSGDQETVEAELRAATEIWPRNPALAEVAGLIFDRADVQQRALVDFDQLLSQRNYRQIFDDRARFIAATAVYPERAQELEKILEQMTLVEGAILRAQEIERRGDPIGAWESVERAHQEFPDDSKLNQLRADLTTKAAAFVSQLRTAESHEQRGQLGSSLAWYLQAQQSYPPSDFAREGIARIIPKIFPDDLSLR